ncbi:MAG: GNAT family N-acetyltransferase [Candidatus Limnocylindrales bacterium]|jgi:predicted acetyltransferase
MSVEIRTCPPDRFAELLKTAEIGFGEDVSDELIERVRKVSDPERFVCALDGDRFVATGGVFSVNLSVPGGDLPAGGVTWVTVLPSHRRRGILRGMMRLMVDDCHARNEPLAMLWASEGAIYQRFGYGMATFCLHFEAETAAARFTREWPVEGSCRLMRVGEGLDLVTPVYEAVRAQRAGFLSRTPDWWVGQLPLADKDAKGGEARRLVVYEADHGPEAYAVYKTKADWGPRGPNGTVIVEEALGSTERGTREIWRYLFSVDLVRTLKAGRLPVDHPALLLAAEPRRLGMGLDDGLWLRIVDVKAALEGRTYGIDGHGNGQVVFDLSDEYCPWNAGRWNLEVSGGRAHVAPTKREADLALDANDLGSLFLGGFSAASLARAGRVVELRSGGLAAADGLFRTALQPWCPQEF